MQTESSNDIQGGCLCRQARYRLTMEPLTCYVCHCTECQQRTGSAFSTALIVMSEALELIKGTSSPYRASLSGGRIKSGLHCSECSTRLWGTIQSVPTIRVLQPGTLDEPTRFRPVAHVWARSSLPWVVFPDRMRTYQENAPFEELAALWQQSRETSPSNVTQPSPQANGPS